jgi:hypothetical protein
MNRIIPTAILNPDASPESLEAKQPAINNGAEIYGKSGYFSHEQVEQEWEKIWTDSWLIAGVSTDLPNVGDYFLFRVRSESLIITKTAEGIKAFITFVPIEALASSPRSAATKRSSSALFTAGASTTTASCAPLPTKTPFKRP